MILDTANLQEASFFSSDDTTDVLVKPPADVFGDQRNPLLRTENDMVDELRKRPGHHPSSSSGSYVLRRGANPCRYGFARDYQTWRPVPICLGRALPMPLKGLGNGNGEWEVVGRPLTPG